MEKGMEKWACSLFVMGKRDGVRELLCVLITQRGFHMQPSSGGMFSLGLSRHPGEIFTEYWIAQWSTFILVCVTVSLTVGLGWGVLNNVSITAPSIVTSSPPRLSVFSMTTPHDCGFHGLRCKTWAQAHDFFILLILSPLLPIIHTAIPPFFHPPSHDTSQSVCPS